MAILYEFEDKNAEKARILAGQGFDEEEIRLMTGVPSVKKLRRLYGKQMAIGPVSTNHQVADSLYNVATDGKNTSAMMFWLKCRAKWNQNPGSEWDDEDVEVVFGTCERVEE